MPETRITEDGQSRLTEAGELRILEATGGTTLLAETRTANHTYLAADFSTEAPLYIVADPSAGPVTLTFPNPADFNVGPNEMRQIAIVLAANSDHDVSIGCAAATRMRSQPGTSGWNPNTHLVKMGAMLANQDEADVSIYIDGTREAGGLMKVTGLVRA